MANSDVRASVEIPAGVVNRGYKLFRRQKGSDTWRELGSFTGDSHTLEDLVVGTAYEVAVAIIDGAGNTAPEKDWTIQTITPRGSDERPPAPTNFTVVQDGEYLDLEWDDVSERMRDFKQYEVRKGASWADARRVAFGSSFGKMRIKWETSGSQTYRIVTLDKFGKRSSEATFAITVQALEQFSDGTTLNEDGGGFAGTKSGTEVDTGKLQYSRWGRPISSVTDLIEDCTWPFEGPLEGSYETAETDLGSDRLVRLEANIAVDTDGDTMSRPIADIALPIAAARNAEDGTPLDVTDQESVIDLRGCVIAADERPIDVEVQVKIDTVSPITTSYQRWVPGFYKGQYVRFKVILRSWDRWRRPRLSTLRFLERKRNLKDEGQIAVVSSPGPTVITFAESFIDTPRVVANSDTSGHIVQIVSVTTTQATVRVYDDAGSEVFAGNLDWIAAGT
jgi:hypothetical protein